MSEYKFEAVGMFARVEAIHSLGRRRSEYWALSDNALAEKYPDGEKRIYAYSFPAVTCELVPEPDNPHDPNAIMVVLDGQHVGYVPATECATVRALMRRPESIRASVGKGPCKVISNGAVRHYDDDFTVRVTIEYDGKPVTRSVGSRGRTVRVPVRVVLQWVAAAVLLIFGLTSLPALSGFLFLLAAILAAPVRPLRELLARYHVRPWMIGAAAAVLTILAFAFFRGSAA